MGVICCSAVLLQKISEFENTMWACCCINVDALLICCLCMWYETGLTIFIESRARRWDFFRTVQCQLVCFTSINHKYFKRLDLSSEVNFMNTSYRFLEHSTGGLQVELCSLYETRLHICIWLNIMGGGVSSKYSSPSSSIEDSSTCCVHTEKHHINPTSQTRANESNQASHAKGLCSLKPRWQQHHEALRYGEISLYISLYI